MAYRNWKQELTDHRPAGASRRWPAAVAIWLVALTAVVCCALWIWPGFLRPTHPAEAPASAEQLYLAPNEPDRGDQSNGEQP